MLNYWSENFPIQPDHRTQSDRVEPQYLYCSLLTLGRNRASSDLYLFELLPLTFGKPYILVPKGKGQIIALQRYVGVRSKLLQHLLFRVRRSANHSFTITSEAPFFT